MEQLISDASTDARMSGLERFLEHYLGPRRPEFGTPADVVASIEMPAPLRRFFGFAGRWPLGIAAGCPNRFCIQDELCLISESEWSGRDGWLPIMRVVDDRLIFVWENQGVWAAATEPGGDDPPVWISADGSKVDTNPGWRRLEDPLSHFLVSFVLQEVLFGSDFLTMTPGALATFEEAALLVEPVWIRGEYAADWDRPSYYLVDHRFLVRRAPKEGGGEDWYGCKDEQGAALLTSLGLPLGNP
jgi:hypothetical protein